MDDIAIGVVFHGTDSVHALRSGRGFDLLTHVNASNGEGASWRGFAANHNDLMSQTRARWYIALNPDVDIEPSAIRLLVDVAEEAGVALAGPAIASPWGTNSRGKRGFPSSRVWMEESILGAARRERTVRVRGGIHDSDWLSGACLAIRRDLGLRFDERYFMYFEDADLCRRAWQQGLRVGLCPSVIARHTSGWSPDDRLVRRRGVEFARSAIVFAESAGMSGRAMSIAGMVRFGSRVALHHARSSQRAAASSIARGFANPSLPGLSELAAEFNARQGRAAPVGARDGVV